MMRQAAIFCGMALVWALGLLAVRIVHPTLPLFTLFAAVYGFCGGLVLVIAAVRSPSPLVHFGSVSKIVAIGLLRFAGLSSLVLVAQTATLSARAIAMMTGVCALWPLLERLMRLRRLVWLNGLALVLAAVGFYAMLAPQWHVPSELSAALWAVTGGVMLILSFQVDKMQQDGSDSLASVGWQMITASVTCTIGSMIVSESIYPADASTVQYVWLLFYVFVSVIGFQVVLSDLRVGARHRYLFFAMMLLPAFSALAAVPMLGETPAMSDWLGMAAFALAALITAITSAGATWSARQHAQVRDPSRPIS